MTRGAHAGAGFSRRLPAPGIACALLGLGAAGAGGAAAQIAPQEAFDLERAEVEVAADRTSYAPGQTARLAVRLDIEPGWHTQSHEPTYDYLIPTRVVFEVPDGWPAPEPPDYPEGEMQTFGFAPDPISVYDRVVHIRSELAVPAGAEPGTYPLRASVTYQACDDKMCLAPVTAERTLGLTVGTEGALANQGFFGAGAQGAEGAEAGAGAAGAARDAGARGFLWFVLLGFVGGLILNAMPCVLPILSLKVFGLVKSAEGGRGAVASGSLATAAGILLSFLLLAAAAIAARSAGVAVGWGIQFQEPIFVGALAVVMLLFALNLWGLFEIPLPMWFTRVGAAGPSEGLAGHLTAGFFATLMATPCSAPFLGTALGFALTQEAATTAAMFGAIGTGMASPYLLLAAFPGLGRALPKPGPWMRTFRVVMGFLLAATLVWLLFVLSGLVSPARVAFFEIALLAIALTVWLASRSDARRRLKLAAGLATLALAVGGVALLGRGLSGSEAPSTLGVAPEDRLIAWEPFDRERAEREAAAGRHVFVDITADWCLTCKVNERLFLETEEVAGAFERHGVLAMRADWTRRDEAIGRYLADFGRYGIPFYVLYRPGREPHIFSELLSKSAILELLGD